MNKSFKFKKILIEFIESKYIILEKYIKFNIIKKTIMSYKKHSKNNNYCFIKLNLWMKNILN